MHRLFETPENSVKAEFLAGKKACAEALQGWLKGVNSSSMLHTQDMGRDGLPGLYANFVRDVFGYSIDYYSDSINGMFDYLPINRNATPFLANRGSSTLNDPDRNLYNGNISYLTTAVPDVAQLPNTIYPSPMVRHFHYDKLNRITKQETADFDLANNKWLDKNSKYATNYALDPNGNFLTLNRNDEQPLIMDSLAYSYFTSTKDYYNGQKINRLQQVADRANTTAYPLDFEGTSNYNYDDIGFLTSDSGEEIDSLVWSMYGKLKKVIRAENSHKPDLEFWYDPSGNRLCKIVKPRTISGDTTKQNKWTFTWYIRDAQGNIMATYLETHDSTNTDASLLMQQFPMYGSSRLGVQSVSDTLSHIRYTSGAFDGDGFYTSSNEHLPITAQDTNKYEYRPLLKQYELSNHLNNVLVTISAKPILNDSSGVVNFRTGDILSVSDYFPYGALLNTRHWESTNYDFGFNGKINDNEINGWQDYGMRMFDRQNCRFPTPDPLIISGKQYPGLSPYQFAGNTPMQAIDLDGLEPHFISESGVSVLGSQHFYNGNPCYAPKLVVSTKTSIAEQVFPTINQNFNLNFGVSAGYKGMNQDLVGKDIPSNENSKINPRVENISHTDNTLSLLFLGGGTEVTDNLIWVTSDVLDPKTGEVISKNKTFPIRVTEEKQSMSVGPLSLESKEVYVNYKKEVYQYRGGVEKSLNVFKIGAKNSKLNLDISVGVKSDWKNVQQTKK